MSQRSPFIAIVLALLLANSAIAQSVNPLWSDVDLYLALGDTDNALMTLATLSTDPFEKGAALEQAAVIYLEDGRQKQAIKIFEELVGIAGYEAYADTLVKLYFKEGAHEAIAALIEGDPNLPLDEQGEVLVTLAFQKVGRDRPGAGGLRAANTGWHMAGFRFSNSFWGIRNKSFLGDEDREYLQESRLQLRIASDPAETFAFEPELSYSHQSSNVNTTGFLPYDAELYGIKMGVAWRPNANWRIAGGPSVLVAHVDEPDWVDSVDAWEEQPFFWDLRGKVGAWKLRLGYDRSISINPQFFSFGFQSEQRYRARVSRGLWTQNDEIELEGRSYHYGAEQEDFKKFGAMWGHYFEKWPGLWTRLGAARELRRVDEDILQTELGWHKRYSAERSLLAIVNMNANMTTRERELDLLVVSSHKLGKNTVEIGLIASAEVNVSHRKELLLLLTLRR
jgi:hypothetical protein